MVVIRNHFFYGYRLACAQLAKLRRNRHFAFAYARYNAVFYRCNRFVRANPFDFARYVRFYCKRRRFAHLYRVRAALDKRHFKRRLFFAFLFRPYCRQRNIRRYRGGKIIAFVSKQPIGELVSFFTDFGSGYRFAFFYDNGINCNPFACVKGYRPRLYPLCRQGEICRYRRFKIIRYVVQRPAIKHVTVARRQAGRRKYLFSIDSFRRMEGFAVGNKRNRKLFRFVLLPFCRQRNVAHHRAFEGICIAVKLPFYKRISFASRVGRFRRFLTFLNRLRFHFRTAQRIELHFIFNRHGRFHT